MDQARNLRITLVVLVLSMIVSGIALGALTYLEQADVEAP